VVFEQTALPLDKNSACPKLTTKCRLHYSHSRENSHSRETNRLIMKIKF
jgi:hypothetical protein